VSFCFSLLPGLHLNRDAALGPHTVHVIDAGRGHQHHNDLARIQGDWAQFERDYEISSAEFWQLYQSGQMADSFD